MAFDRKDKTPWVQGEKQSPTYGPRELGNKHPVLFVCIFVIVVVFVTYLGGGKGVWF